MGAWGLGLFENDSELDHVGDFSHEAGVEVGDPDKYDEARKVLDSEVLAKMVKKRMPDATNSAKISRGWGVDRSPDYVLVILGACAMQVGAKLPEGLREFMDAKWRELGFQRDGKIQMEHALKEYKDGIPFDFYSDEMEKKMVAAGKGRTNDQLYPGSMMLNVPVPGQDVEATRALNASVQRSLRESGFGCQAPARATPPASAPMPAPQHPAMPPPQHPADTCGFCGSKTGSRSQKGRLLKCTGCHEQLYCSKPCQKSHWKWHKSTCQV